MGNLRGGYLTHRSEVCHCHPQPASRENDRQANLAENQGTVLRDFFGGFRATLRADFGLEKAQTHAEVAFLGRILTSSRI